MGDPSCRLKNAFTQDDAVEGTWRSLWPLRAASILRELGNDEFLEQIA